MKKKGLSLRLKKANGVFLVGTRKCWDFKESAAMYGTDYCFFFLQGKNTPSWKPGQGSILHPVKYTVVIAYLWINYCSLLQCLGVSFCLNQLPLVQNLLSWWYAEPRHPSCTHLFCTVMAKGVASSEPLADCCSSTRNLFQGRDRRKSLVSAPKGCLLLLLKGCGNGIPTQPLGSLTSGSMLQHPFPQSGCHLAVPRCVWIYYSPSQPKLWPPQPFLLVKGRESLRSFLSLRVFFPWQSNWR